MKRLLPLVIALCLLSAPALAWLEFPEATAIDTPAEIGIFQQYAHDLLGIDIPEDGEWLLIGEDEYAKEYVCRMELPEKQQSIQLSISVQPGGKTMISVYRWQSDGVTYLPASDARDLPLKEQLERMYASPAMAQSPLVKVPADCQVIYSDVGTVYMPIGAAPHHNGMLLKTAAVILGGDWTYGNCVLEIYWDPAEEELCCAEVTPIHIP
ncbi:MAG: hypothetical protein E7324_02920 [Clostridiales bacterium]|nr:hypothetical protein [Clostridiales bacterium]